MGESYKSTLAKKGVYMEKGVVFMFSPEQRVDNIYTLPYFGSGYDGAVFAYGDYALKSLKYDKDKREKERLMTFEKAVFFCQNLSLKRIEAPRDILLDEKGDFFGYVMRRIDDLSSDKYNNTPFYMKPGDFSCGQLLLAAEELAEDFAQLSKNGVMAADINPGNFLFPSDYVHLCDTDKYIQFQSSGGDYRNMCTYRYTIAKLLYLAMVNDEHSRKEKRVLQQWVKQSASSSQFIKDLIKDIGTDFDEPISEFARQKVKTILR